MPEGDICTPGVLGFGRRVVLWYHRRVVLGGPDTVQLRTKERPTSVWVAGEMNLTMGRSVERAGRRGREEERKGGRNRGREGGREKRGREGGREGRKKEGKGIGDRGRKRGREKGRKRKGGKVQLNLTKMRLCSHQSVSASYNTTINKMFATKNILWM